MGAPRAPCRLEPGLAVDGAAGRGLGCVVRVVAVGPVVVPGVLERRVGPELAKVDASGLFRSVFGIVQAVVCERSEDGLVGGEALLRADL